MKINRKTMLASLFSTLLAGPVFADEVIERIESGLELYQRGDVGAAIAEMEAALENMRARPSSGATTDQTTAPAATNTATGTVADDPAIAERTIDETVFYGLLEFTIQEMNVIDLDAELEPHQPPRGMELVCPTRVFNTTRDNAAPSSVRMALQWHDPTTGDSFVTAAQSDFRTVPGEASTSGEVRVRLTPQDLERFDDASAHLVVGQPGRTPAIVPIGADAERVSRLPRPQQTDGWTFVVEGEDARFRRNFEDTVTITDAEVMWVHGNRALDDGYSLLELTYTVENNSSAQTCSQRREGSWRLTLPNGDAVTDLRVSERCVGQGETVEGIMTGFLIPSEDFAGDYVLAHRRGGGGDSDPWGEVAITLEAGAGVPFSDRR